MANINQADLMKLFKQQAEEANANQIMLNMNPFMMNNTNTRNQRNQRTDDYDDDDDYNRVQRRGGGRATKGPRGSNPREDGSCFKCGKKGHWANSCPETTKAKELEMQLQIAQLKAAMAGETTAAPDKMTHSAPTREAREPPGGCGTD